MEVTIERNGETQTVRIEKQRYEQIHKQAVAAFRASIVPIDGKPYTTEIICLDKVLTDEIELAVGYQIAEKLISEAEAEGMAETDDESEQ